LQCVWTNLAGSSVLREFFVFLGYHIPQKDGRKEIQKKQKVPKYPKYTRMRNICRSKIEHVYLKAPHTMNAKKTIPKYPNIDI